MTRAKYEIYGIDITDIVEADAGAERGTRQDTIDEMRADLHHRFPNLTDEDLWEIANTT